MGAASRDSCKKGESPMTPEEREKFLENGRKLASQNLAKYGS
jgi:hypothetical protein